MSLNDIAEANGRIGDVNHTMFSQTFKEWNFWQCEKDLIQEKKWCECPCCEIKQHIVVMLMEIANCTDINRLHVEKDHLTIPACFFTRIKK